MADIEDYLECGLFSDDDSYFYSRDKIATIKVEIPKHKYVCPSICLCSYPTDLLNLGRLVSTVYYKHGMQYRFSIRCIVEKSVILISNQSTTYYKRYYETKYDENKYKSFKKDLDNVINHSEYKDRVLIMSFVSQPKDIDDDALCEALYEEMIIRLEISM